MNLSFLRRGHASGKGYDSWQNFIATGVNVALCSRLNQLNQVPVVFDKNKMIANGLLQLDERGKIIGSRFDDNKRSFLCFIQTQLGVDFNSATAWALEFISKTTPDRGEENNECRCEKGECDHS